MLFAFNLFKYNIAKSLYYLKTPTQPIIVYYYCQKFCTLFTFNNFNILSRQAIFFSSFQKFIYMDIDITSKQVRQLKEIISQSPISKTTTVSLLTFLLSYSITQQETSSSLTQTPKI
ncbi:21959_t:CDS:1 [Cetraspora pellucida]|uniref:21959_t:CDS:1 n=1 Tax=Cetraspora pellucida TaxID=1433469 RepID=A0A9N8W274_9GLOM|nr:21959_t:CDS:1 [Cetraspora pellucida]